VNAADTINLHPETEHLSGLDEFVRYFPIFVDLDDQRVVVSGADETAVAKLRLLLKTQADVHVFGTQVADTVAAWDAEGRVTLHRRAIEAEDVSGARLVYAANDDVTEDGRTRRLAQNAGVLCNVVDTPDSCDFITPAVVDRDPVTVAIGTEGTAPVLARQIKADIEARLPSDLGLLARIGAGCRKLAERVPTGRARRAMWAAFFGGLGREALNRGGADGCADALRSLIKDTAAGVARASEGRVVLVGAGPGDPELLTVKARNVLHDADVVLHDRLVDPRVLELARREALLVEVGKQAGGAAWKQDDINAEAIRHAQLGHVVVRLKSGDPMMFGRADEELDAFEAAGVRCDVVPGVTSAIAAAAQMQTSLTRRGRNSGIVFLTAHDLDGYAEHDWRALAAPGAAAAIYMGVKAARFVQGRLMLHGAASDTPVTVVENISHPDERIISSTLSDLQTAMETHTISGPAIIFFGLAARRVSAYAALSVTDSPSGHVPSVPPQIAIGR